MWRNKLAGSLELERRFLALCLSLSKAKLFELLDDLEERTLIAVKAAEAGLEEARASVAGAKARVGELEASVASLKLHIDKHSLKAPFEGSLEKHLAEPGEVVSSGVPVAVLSRESMTPA